jgi:hypothetical protein
VAILYLAVLLDYVETLDEGYECSLTVDDTAMVLQMFLILVIL